MKTMLLFLMLASGSVYAQVAKVTPLLTRELPDVPGKEGLMVTVELAPGEVDPAHRHNADVFVYVLEGSLVTQLNGGKAQTVHAGESFYESPTDIHSASHNASKTRPVKLLVFFVKTKGTPPTVVVGDGKGAQ